MPPPSAKSSFVGINAMGDSDFVLTNFPVESEDDEHHSMFEPSLDASRKRKKLKGKGRGDEADEASLPLLEQPSTPPQEKLSDEDINPADVVYTFAWCIKIHKGNLRTVFNNLENANFVLRIVMFLVLATSVTLIIVL